MKLFTNWIVLLLVLASSDAAPSPPSNRLPGRQSGLKLILIPLTILGVVGIARTTQITSALSKLQPSVNDAPSLVLHPGASVEELMYKYKSDKSRDDHGYTKLYHMIFSPIKNSVRNITEVGISAGQSLQAWFRYFPNAEIHAFDIMWYGEDKKPSVQENLSFLAPRVKPHIVDILKAKDMASLGFLPESMDIIIEDGPHSLDSQQDFLVKLFPLVKPGGYYIIEDVGYVQGAVTAFREDPSKLRNDTRAILENHETIFVDTAAGHRAWDTWQKLVGGLWVRDRVRHNSYCVVIQKRETPLPPLDIHYKKNAMDPGSIVAENGDW